MPARTKKTPIVLVYDPTDEGRFAFYDEGTLAFEGSDENNHYFDFLAFCQKFNIPYEERDMSEGLGGEEFPRKLEDLKPKVSVHIEIDTCDEAEYLNIMTDDTDLGWVSKTDAIAIRDRLVEALGKC
jgi:hypothetical protein